MVRSALIISPHPDDEINLAGQLTVSLLKQSVEVFVVYTTNGDYSERVGNRRLAEAIHANELLGIDEEHVFFLGYANEWQENTHIFIANDCIISALNKKQTNSIPEHPEFCYVRHGVHHTFTRENFKNDMKEAISLLKPDLLIAPEFDAHPDHRAACLIFDEVMGEILKSDALYRPIILKKSIHEGIWHGEKDYYRIPMTPTIPNGPREYSGTCHDLDFPSCTWSECIRLDTDPLTRTLLLKDNIVYKAAKAHALTTSWYQMQRVINADAVYWFRPVSNLMLSAEITVSSGNGKFLNDFLQYGTRNILPDSEAFSDEEAFCWTPDENDTRKRIDVHFANRVRVSEIRVFENCHKDNHISELRITVGDICLNAAMNENGTATVVAIPEQLTDEISFEIRKGYGKMGIAEIEVYSKHPSFCFSAPFKEYMEYSGRRKTMLCQKLERMLIMAKYLFSFKLEYEWTRLKRRIIK